MHYSRRYAEDVTSVTSGASQSPHSFNLVFVCLCVCVMPGAIPYLSCICPVSVCSRSYAEDVTSVTSGVSQGPHSFNSRRYAEDVTSVTPGASQGPQSFNLVFVCLCVCVTSGAIPYLFRTVPYHQTQLATNSWPQYLLPPVSVSYRTVPSKTAGHKQLATIFK